MKIAIAMGNDPQFASEEDLLLKKVFASRDIISEIVCWNDHKINWQDYQCILIKSCWNYHRVLSSFLKWLHYLEALQVKVFNPRALVEWNANKLYLRDLQQQGISIIPTVWLTADSLQPTLYEILNREEWQRAIVKPMISASADGLWLTDLTSAIEEQPRLEEILRTGRGVMVQKFIEVIMVEGEWSLIFFAGVFSHAVLKKPASGDFRVQEEYGGLAVVKQPPHELIRQAENILACLKTDWIYARVDVIWVNDELTLVELEMIEPFLYLSAKDDAAQRLVTVVLDNLRY
ncbi:MAG: hypothetical protein AB1489_37150 [Acidobacteriota bacterium]